MKISIQQYILIYDTTCLYADFIDETTIEFPPHPNICGDEFIEELKYKYTDIILYKDDKWTDEKYSNKYSYLLQEYKDIIKIKIEFFISKI